MFETETVGPCLVQKLKWEGGIIAPCPPQWLRPCNIYQVYQLISNDSSYQETQYLSLQLITRKLKFDFLSLIHELHL